MVRDLRRGTATVALHRVTARLLIAGAELAASAGDWPGWEVETLLDVAARPEALRLEAERELLACARLAATRAERIRYVEEAYQARPFTMF